MKISFLSLCLLGFVTALPALAAEGSFATPAQTHVTQILPSPPLPDSELTKAELLQLHQLQATRSAGDVARAVADDQEETMFIYRDVLGPKFDAAALPLTAALSARV